MTDEETTELREIKAEVDRLQRRLDGMSSWWAPFTPAWRELMRDLDRLELRIARAALSVAFTGGTASTPVVSIVDATTRSRSTSDAAYHGGAPEVAPAHPRGEPAREHERNQPMKTTKATVKLIELESLLHDATQRAGRAVRNMEQESGGYSSTTPGNGSPGGGKGGRAMATIDGEDIPCTAVERQALGLAGRDVAAERLSELDRKARAAADGLGRAMHRVGLPLLVPTDAVPSPERMVVLAYSRAVRLRRVADRHDGPTWDRLLGDAVADAEPSVLAVFHLCQTWGYDPRRPAVRKEAADVLAVDLTERWCTSHLRVGAKRERDRGELCQWCRKFRDAEGFIPPRELVQIHVDAGRVYDHQVVPFRQAHRDRVRNKARA